MSCGSVPASVLQVRLVSNRVLRHGTRFKVSSLWSIPALLRHAVTVASIFWEQPVDCKVLRARTLSVTLPCFWIRCLVSYGECVVPSHDSAFKQSDMYTHMYCFARLTIPVVDWKHSSALVKAVREARSDSEDGVQAMTLNPPGSQRETRFLCATDVDARVNVAREVECYVHSPRECDGGQRIVSPRGTIPLCFSCSEI